MSFIPYGHQSIDDTDIAAVVEVLRSDWLTQGPSVSRFEQAVCQFTGAAHAVAMSSATAALHLACLALGLGQGGRLWTVPNTFIASANCGRYCGASVDFVDIDARSYCIDVEALAGKLEQAARLGTLPDVLVAVDFAGQPCDYAKIIELKRRYGFKVIEDASHAIGSEYEGVKVGSLAGIDCTIFSFHPVKLITTAEGGMALTQDAELAHRLAMLRSHGIERDPTRLNDTSQGAWYYEQQALGFNYRLTDVQAALGSAQMQRLPAFLAKRHALVARYDELLAELPLVLPWQAPHTLSARHLYPILLADAAMRRHVFDQMRAHNIGVQVHYIPVHLQPDYKRLGFGEGDFPVAENYYQRTLSLPLYADLSIAQQDEVIARLKEFLA
ncbi:UDP-4-amino-4,6-dideoxy-N-acetyl-beta-L-altrosamine transaminase [Uliginosibacterium gangwonense]|uniref:UDP-4-amino-4, 6-dideoxy-N-acetyl-beta-L-altrosamine transaminase n=1 Tax=Uliginosibacterium gangwonense TaxID=392736 RepID=UPI0003606EE1|nr:UDP-4-amino-4,6-dideoxy-N-acetyl-beta-L-altrosamine transaminase [Uliginosibacterium gangwonense]